MSNLVNYDDATAVLGAYATQIKKIKPEEITYAAYQALSDVQKTAKRYLITDYPAAEGGGGGASGVIPVDPEDTSNINIWIETT